MSSCLPDASAARDARNEQWLALVRRARGGDTGAFEALYECSAPWLLRAMRRLLGPDDAEDAVAEAYIQAWHELDRFDVQRSPVAGWLMLIARSRAVDLLRTRRRRQAVEAEGAAEEAVRFLGRSELDPERQLARIQILRLLQLQLHAALSAEEQVVIALAYFDELSHFDIAQRLGIPLGTVKSRMTRAQLKLRAALAPGCARPLFAGGNTLPVQETQP